MNFFGQDLLNNYFVEVAPGVKLHINDTGKGDVIVFIHGWLINNAIFQQQHDTLSKKGWRVISISLRGHGCSDRPPEGYSYDQFADDIKVVFEKLKINDAILAGFSMGGAIAVHYAAKYNGKHISGLVLIGAAAPSFIQREDYPYGIKRQQIDELIDLLDQDINTVYDMAGKTMGNSPQSFSEAQYEWLNSIFIMTELSAAKHSLESLAAADLRQELKEIDLRVTIFHGMHDQVCPFSFAEQMQRHLRNSRLIPFENSGHALFLEESDEFHRQLFALNEKDIKVLTAD